MTDLIFQLRGAVAWRVLCELYRRHDSHRLRLAIHLLHPCGGQAMMPALMVKTDDPSAADDFVHNSLVMFSLGGGGVHFGNCSDGSDTQIDDYLGYASNQGIRSLIDRVGDLLHLGPVPKPLPSTTPQSLCYRIAATLMERHVFDREGIKLESGFIDTSGYGGGLHPALQEFTSLKSSFPTNVSTVRIQSALDHWVLGHCEGGAITGKALGVLTTSGQLHLPNGSVVDCIDLYEKLFRKMGRLAHEIERHIGLY